MNLKSIIVCYKSIFFFRITEKFAGLF